MSNHEKSRGKFRKLNSPQGFTPLQNSVDSTLKLIKRSHFVTGFTIFEVFIVVSIVFLLAAGLGSVNILRARKTAEQNICLEQRRAIEHSEIAYFAQTGRHTANLQDLVSATYLAIMPKCPAQGIFTWVAYPKTSNNYQTILGCSIHGIYDELGTGSVGLAARWKMDEGAGTTTGSGAFSAQLINGPKWVDGKAGKALQFNGNKSYAHIADNSALDLTDSGTLGAWIYTGSSLNSRGGIIHKGDNSDFSDEAYSLQLYNGKIRLAVDPNSGATKYLDTKASLAANRWYYVAATWDNTGMKVYLNGALSNSNKTQVAARDTSGGVNIGAQFAGGSSSYRYKGKIDEAVIYNRALSSAEIQSYYDSTK